MTPGAIVLLEDDARHEFARWSVAAAFVLAAHLGLAASYLLLRTAHPEGSPEAPIVILDFAPLPVAPLSELDIAPGPQMQEAIRPPEPEVKTELELPPKTETPVIAALEKPKPEAKPETKPPAPRTTAAPRNLTNTAAIPAAPAPGSTNTSVFPPSWINLLFSHLLRYRQYPSAAQASRQEGVVTLNFTMDRNGHVLSRHIVRSSGFAALDAEVLAMIERAQPLPSFPLNMTAATRSFTAPIKFSLR